MSIMHYLFWPRPWNLLKHMRANAGWYAEKRQLNPRYRELSDHYNRLGNTWMAYFVAMPLGVIALIGLVT